jgi:thioesterase domain-containing protein
MGHSRIWDANGYDKSYRDIDAYRREYEKALPWLNIMSSSRAFGQINEEEVESLRAEVQRLKTEKDNRMARTEENLEALQRENVDLKKRIDQIQETRHESDSDLNMLFRDKDVQDLLKRKIKELKL